MNVQGTGSPYSRTFFTSNVGKRKERAGRFSHSQEESKLHKKVFPGERTTNARLEAVKERLQQKLERKKQEEKDVNLVAFFSHLSLAVTILNPTK
ncbi:hypothetical protein [Candidatus Protochlamydia phocaeensis]|uniref:hypothetical protein n=1 Tax=Candidatus Protochlamydia phocaeensis TaxID=1414722 RepID=UPI000837BE4A|nr:hypothetical protein [Candidatus Protochlamydia phocaeensis]